MREGMTDAHLGILLRQSEERLFVELLDCTCDPERSIAQLYQMALETDRIRGGMAGMTDWSTCIKYWIIGLRRRDGEAWDRLYRYVPRVYRYCATDAGMIDLYARFKEIHVFEVEQPTLL